MIVFDFLYFCIYSFVPDKAIFGKRDVACTFLSSFTAILSFLLFIQCALIFHFKINVALCGVILFGGLFVLTRVIYLKPAKFRSMHRRFRKIPKWLLKTIGILYLLLCFFIPMGLHIYLGK
jgi:hypothetical protein